jgi:hypothetical protein
LSNRFLFEPALVVFLVSSGVSIADTDSPQDNLGRASYLFDRANRPFAADECIADGWLTYGFFFRPRSVDKQEKSYQKDGFLDASATFDTRFDKFVEYFEMTASAFALQRRFDRASNAYLNEGFTFAIAGRKADACAAFTKSLDSYKKNKDLHPNAAQDVPKAVNNFDELLANERTRLGCTS